MNETSLAQRWPRRAYLGNSELWQANVQHFREARTESTFRTQFQNVSEAEKLKNTKKGRKTETPEQAWTGQSSARKDSLGNGTTDQTKKKQLQQMQMQRKKNKGSKNDMERTTNRARNQITKDRQTAKPTFQRKNRKQAMIDNQSICVRAKTKRVV